MKLIIKGGKRDILYHKKEKEFWEDIKISVVSEEAEMLYDDVVNKILSCI